MTAPPPRTPEQRRAAAARAVAARAVRARIRGALRAGDLTLADVLALADGDDDDAAAVAGMRLEVVLAALPGVGERTVDRTLVALGVPPGRKLRGLGPRQREALLAGLAPRTGRATGNG